MKVVAGASPNRSLPEFFKAGFDCPVTQVASPNFAVKGARSVSLAATVLTTLRNTPLYRRSLKAMAAEIKEAKPDLIVNFYEPLMGVLNALGGNARPTLAVGHQYMLGHPTYPRVAGMEGKKRGMLLYNKLVGANSAKAGLSFYPGEDLPEARLTVVPPILREEIFSMSPVDEGFLLVYLLNHGYSEDIIRWSGANPGKKLHCFYDKPGEPEEKEHSPDLTFHRLNGAKFLEMMRRCHGVVCTAGFESISEAGWLGKRILAVPVANHFEQQLNAVDAEQCGLATGSRTFDLGKIFETPEPPGHLKFKEWLGRAESLYGQVIARAAGRAAS